MNFTPVQINIPVNNNSLLEKVLGIVNENKELQTLWRVNNINAIDRLGYSDHGYTHAQIVANIALRIARAFKKASIELSVIKNYDLSYDYGEIIIFLSSLMHDIGMSINREGHEELSLFIARDLMKDMLSFMSVEERTIVISETLHAILNHRSDGKPLTIEAGIVRVSDALDMTRGRSRIPFEAGSVNIHSISAYAIEKINISQGTEKPVKIEIEMNNSAGLFQVDELLKKKLHNSGIGQYLEIKASVQKPEESLLKEFTIESEE